MQNLSETSVRNLEIEAHDHLARSMGMRVRPKMEQLVILFIQLWLFLIDLPLSKDHIYLVRFHAVILFQYNGPFKFFQRILIRLLSSTVLPIYHIIVEERLDSSTKSAHFLARSKFWIKL